MPTWACSANTLSTDRATEENNLLTINGRFYVQLYCATRGRKSGRIPDRQNFPFPVTANLSCDLVLVQGFWKLGRKVMLPVCGGKVAGLTIHQQMDGPYQIMFVVYMSEHHLSSAEHPSEENHPDACLDRRALRASCCA